MFVSGWSCVPYFLATVLIGNLVILNLFLALLLASFSDMGADAADDEPDKIAIAFGRFGRFKRWMVGGIKGFFKAIGRGFLFCVTCGKKGRPSTEHQGENGATMSRELTGHSNSMDVEKGEREGGATRSYTDTKIGEGMDISIHGRQNGSILQSKESWKTANSGLIPEMGSARALGGSMPVGMEFGKDEEESVHSGDSSWRRSKKKAELSSKENVKKEEEALSYMEEVQHVDEVMYDPVDEIVVMDCCPARCYEVCPCCAGDSDSPLWHEWHKHRMQMSRLIEDKYFETVVLALILMSSFVMTLEDVWFETRPLLVDCLYYLDRILTVVFFLETCLKLLAMGVVAYFGNAWCWLDFVIVGVSLINFAASLLGAGNIPIFKTMRTLRALRPLRAMAKMEGMKVVVGALIGALPSIINVLLVCLIFWLIFAIIGVNMFMGKFQECIDLETGIRFSHDVVPNKTVCLTFEKGLWTVAKYVIKLI
jgi:voltage-gated sodium channel type II alpha